VKRLERLCRFLSSNYYEVACWIQQQETTKKRQLLDKDDLGQTLLPDDIILGEENRFLACKATGDGDYLLNSESRILVGNESLRYFLRLLTTLKLYTNSAFYAI